MSRYSAALLNYFFNTAHAGDLPVAPNVLIGSAGHAENGDVVEFYVQHHQNNILKMAFKAFGVPATIAACEYVCQQLEQQSLHKIQKITAEQIMSALQISAFKIHSVNLVITALNKVLMIY